jgi:4-methyl-5(b-hydroxyethyl)-thiazole monophosphate biosynthesis
VAKRVCVLLVDGFEEIEAVTVVDVLRRSKIHTTVIGVEHRQPTGSHGIAVLVDALLADVVAEAVNFDGVVLPGGMLGAARLRDHAVVGDFIVKQHQAGALTAAICAAPMVLGRLGLLRGKEATCFPGFEAELTGATVVTADVVDAGDVVTSRGVGTALAFALALVARFADAEQARVIRDAMLVRHTAG